MTNLANLKAEIVQKSTWPLEDLEDKLLVKYVSFMYTSETSLCIVDCPKFKRIQ